MNQKDRMLYILAHIGATAQTVPEFLLFEDFSKHSVSLDVCRDPALKELGLGTTLNVFNEDIPTYLTYLGYTALGKFIIGECPVLTDRAYRNFAHYLFDPLTYLKPNRTNMLKRVTALGHLLARGTKTKREEFKMGSNYKEYKAASDLAMVVNILVLGHPAVEVVEN